MNGSRTLLTESTCLKHISLQPRFWKGRIAAIQFLELLQQETTVVRYFVNYILLRFLQQKTPVLCYLDYNPMLSKQRWWNSGSRTLLIESTCLKHISLQPRVWKARIAANQFSALLLLKTPVLTYFGYNTMLSRIAAVQFLAVLQQKTFLWRHFIYNPMLRKQRWGNSVSRTLLIESTCLKHISLQPRFWKGRIAANQFLELLQQETAVVRYFVNCTLLSKQRWWNAGSRTLLIERTCLRRISLPPRFWKGIIAAIRFLALLLLKTPVLTYFGYNTMLSKQRWWNPGSRTLLIESTCLKHISLQPRVWKGRIAAVQFLAVLQQKTFLWRHFIYNPMLRKQRWGNSVSRTLVIESTCLKHISLQPRFWKGRIAAIQFLELLQQETTVVRYFVNYTLLSKQRWWSAGSRTLLIERTCLRRISLPPRFWKGRIAAIQFSAL
ncbi:hypothetical protein ANTQUA_LOCUS3462 [Anthophora quadrimaculata]